MIYLFFDLETTGFSNTTDKVIEIAAAAYDMNTNSIIETFQTFINPGVSIPPKITEITSITNQMVKHAPTEQKAFEDFSAFIKKHNPSFMAGHNIRSFDMKWVAVRNDRFKLNLNNNIPLIDTLDMVRDVAKKGLLKGYNFKTPTGRPSFKLQYLMEYFELGEQNHRAIDDVLNNIIVFRNLKKLEVEDNSLGF